MTKTLEERWRELCRGAPPAAVEGTFADVARRYGERHRAYHTLAHLEHVFRELDTVRGLLAVPAAVDLAAFYHDAVYAPFPLSGKNEERSAALCARAAADLGFDPGVVRRATRLVLATKRHEIAPDDELGDDGRLFLDADMAILGQEPAVFAAYERAIRREFRVVPQVFFARRRRAFFASLAARPRVFLSEPFHERYEAAARANIATALGPGLASPPGED